MNHGLSHLDEHKQPRMVDVSEKDITVREAVAEALVHFPEDAWKQLSANGFTTKKGPIADVAKIAGTMAVKRTAELVPLCHPLPIDGCTFSIDSLEESRLLRIACTVKTTARTGVEMEALTGASAAALTVYDMTKSLGHGITIEKVRLLAKSGGKSNFSADEL